MRLIGFLAVVGIVVAAPIRALQSDPGAAGPTISIEDVDRFYRIYDAAHGLPSADDLQRNYLDQGSKGLHEVARLRRISGTAIAENLAKHPEMYSNARYCADVLPQVRKRLAVALRKLSELYPDSRVLPVTVVVGRGKPGGVGSPVTGVQIGLENVCAVKWENPNLEDRFVHVIAHEYAHVQQVTALVDDEHPTVLEASLIEGAADFVGELISGGLTSSYLAQTKGREKEIEAAFVSDEDKTDLSQWLYNSTMEKQGDLGYWIGYRIVKSYYQHASDKRQALKDILQMSDPKEFLHRSGWYPGIRLQ